MAFLNTKEININSYNLKQPIFDPDLNLFISKFQNEDEQFCGIQSPSLKFINVENSDFIIEFLPSTNEFYKFINNFDDYMKNLIMENGSGWFNTNLNIDTINNIFKKSIDLPLNLPSLPIMKFKIDQNTKILNSKIKKKNKKINVDELINNMEIEIKFYIEGILFYKNKCHPVYSVNEIRVINNSCQSLECLFMDSEDDDIQSESNAINTVTNV